jgi:hypothetical protein
MPEDVLSSATFFSFFRIFIGCTSAQLAIFGLKVGLVAIDVYYYFFLNDGLYLLVFLLIS